MKKLYLPALLLLIFCSCTNNQETVDKGKINSVETRSVEVKSVRDYIESDEFIRRCVKMRTFFFYAQSPDFHKQGLCYYLKILYL